MYFPLYSDVPVSNVLIKWNHFQDNICIFLWKGICNADDKFPQGKSRTYQKGSFTKIIHYIYQEFQFAQTTIILLFSLGK